MRRAAANRTANRIPATLAAHGARSWIPASSMTAGTGAPPGLAWLTADLLLRGGPTSPSTG